MLPIASPGDVLAFAKFITQRHTGCCIRPLPLAWPHCPAGPLGGRRRCWSTRPPNHTEATVPDQDLLARLERAVGANWTVQSAWLQNHVRFPSRRGQERPCQGWVAYAFARRGWSVDRIRWAMGSARVAPNGGGRAARPAGLLCVVGIALCLPRPVWAGSARDYLNAPIDSWFAAYNAGYAASVTPKTGWTLRRAPEPMWSRNPSC